MALIWRDLGGCKSLLDQSLAPLSVVATSVHSLHIVHLTTRMDASLATLQTDKNVVTELITMDSWSFDVHQSELNIHHVVVEKMVTAHRPLLISDCTKSEDVLQTGHGETVPNMLWCHCGGVRLTHTHTHICVKVNLRSFDPSNPIVVFFGSPRGLQEGAFMVVFVSDGK